MAIFRKIALAVATCGIALAAQAQKDSFTLRFADSFMRQNPVAANIGPDGKAKASWAYDLAMLARVYFDLYKATGNEAYYNYMRAFTDHYVDAQGNISGYKIEEYNLDRVQPARSLIVLHQHTGQENYRKAIEPFIKQLEGHPRNLDGGYWHKQIYTNQMWLDGLYMASPFMAMYARYYNAPEWADQAVLQLRLAYRNTRDPKTGLMYHAWDQSRKMYWCDPQTGLSHHVWGRAVGWYHMALVDVLDYLPADHPGRVELVAILRELSAAIVRNADPATGLWWQVMEYPGREGNYLEGSASAMFVYTMAKAASKGYIDKSYYAVAEKTFKTMQKHFFDAKAPEMVMKDICGGAGLGGRGNRDGSYGYYVNERINPNDNKGVAPMLLAGLILEKLN